MVVHTQSAKAKEGRQQVLEFLLVNHPLDCPVCDQAGECWLQDYYMEHGAYNPRMNENKVKKSKKATPIGKEVMLDQERCILCSRCVRFCDEVTKTSELGIFNRGNKAELSVYPGKELANDYSGNVVDICPVGALTDRDFRFQTRVWYLASADSVCTGCSRGCNIQIHYKKDIKRLAYKAGGKRVLRLKPRYHAQVNQWWMCDQGRYGYHFIDKDRLQSLKDGSWEKAFETLAGRVRGLSQGVAPVALLSPAMSNEELFVARKTLGALGFKLYCVSASSQTRGDNLLWTGERNANRLGAEVQGLDVIYPGKIAEFFGKERFPLVWVFGQDLAAAAGQDVYAAWRKQAGWLVYQGSNANDVSRGADLVLPSAVYAEQSGTFTNLDGRVQRFWPALSPLGDSRPGWQILADFGAVMGLKGLDWQSEEMIFEDLAGESEFFADMNYGRLGKTGLIGRTAAAKV
jgi:NADH-quinone oxidoreductase subunit G